jgi:hypothetical protein
MESLCCRCCGGGGSPDARVHGWRSRPERRDLIGVDVNLGGQTIARAV